MDTPLLVESEGGVVRLTLNRPDKRNALSHALLTQLGLALGRIEGDKSARVIVLSAHGSCFCAGHDLTEMAGFSKSQFQELFTLCSNIMMRLRRLPQPIIARVHGLATAAGCQLVAACDLAVAADTATFATPGIKIGLFCATPMVPLVRAIHPKVALEMLLTGKAITAQRALEVGLINRVMPADQLDAAVEELVQAIMTSSRSILALGKAAFYDELALAESVAYQEANAVMTDNAQRQDAKEGIAAFLQKRSPVWTIE